MAVTQNSYIGNGSTTTYSFTFPYLKSTEIKASLDATVTTAFTTPTATTVQFNTAPANGAKIKIYRETDSDSLTATFYAGSAIKSEDLNDNFTQNLYATQEVTQRYLSNLGGNMVGDLTLNEDVNIVFEGATDDAYETTLTVADPTADRTITLPNVTGTVVTTGDTGTVATGMIAADAVNGTKIADDSINSEHYVDGSIDTAHLADAQITTAKLGTDSVTTVKITDANVTTAKIADANVTTAKIAADAITNAKIADDQIDSEHYVDGSIDTAHIADSQITSAKIADATIVAGDLASNSITTAKITDANVTTAKIADNAITVAKIADAELTELATMSSGTASALADLTQTEVQILDGVTATTAELNILDGVTSTTAEINLLDGVTATTTELNKTDGLTSTPVELNILDGATVNTSEINKLDGVTASTTELNIVSGKTFKTSSGTLDTTSDTEIPSSKVIAAHVASSQTAIGGFITIADEVSFPNTQPATGVVVSINNAAGVVVNGSGVSTTGRRLDSTVVTINGFPSSLNSETLAAGVGLVVTSTSTANTYTYHKLLAAETDVKQLSDDINDFNARYRVASSAPSSSNDDGDLWFDTSGNKMKVYNATGSSWDDVASVGQFFINTLSSSSGTGGGSATFNGSAYRFTLSSPATGGAQQLIVSINGVIQKPNTGTSQPSEGFAIDGNDIIFSAAPASGSDFFIITQGSSVSIGTPSANSVNSSHIIDGSIVNADISSSAAIAGSKLADDSIAEVKLDISNTPTDGYYLKYKDSTDKLTWSAVDLSAYAPLAGATFTGAINAPSAVFTDDGSGQILQVKADDGSIYAFRVSNDTYSTNTLTGLKTYVENDGDVVMLYHGDSEYTNFFIAQHNGTTNRVLFGGGASGNANMYYQGTSKLATSSAGIAVTGTVTDSKGELRTLPANTQAGTYTLVAADAGKYIYASNTVTLPASVFTVGQMITIVNNTAGDITLTASGITLYHSKDGATGSRTLGTRGVATVLYHTASIAYISGSGLS